MTTKMFKLSELFHISGTKSLDAGKLQFKNKGINFIGRINENNGIQGKIDIQNFPPNKGGCITATVIGNYKYAKFQKDDFYTSQNVNKLVPKNKYDDIIMKYFVSHIQKFISKYDGQQSGYKLTDIENHTIKLPTTDDGEIDKVSIRSLMKKKEIQQKSKIIDHLSQEYFDFKELNSKETEYNGNSFKFNEFKLIDIFDVKNTTNLLSNEIIDKKGQHPYVTASRENNGIKTYISHKKDMLMEGNSIFIGGKTFTVFYQPHDYFSNDSHNLQLNLKNSKFRTKEVQLYLVASIYKSLKNKYEWGNSISSEKIQSDTIFLPTKKDNLPDFELMEKIVKSIQKKNLYRLKKHVI